MHESNLILTLTGSLAAALAMGTNSDGPVVDRAAAWLGRQGRDLPSNSRARKPSGPTRSVSTARSQRSFRSPRHLLPG